MRADADVEVTQRRRPWTRFLFPLVGFSLLAWLLSRLDLPALGRAILSADRGAVGLAAAWFSLNVTLKCFRWQRLVSLAGHPLPWNVAFGNFYSSAFLGAVTIGRVGEFLRMRPLVRRGVPGARAAMLCLYDRLIDLLAVVLVGGILGAFVLGATQLAAAVAVGVVAILVGGILALPSIQRWLSGRVHTESPRVLRLMLQMLTALNELRSPRIVAEMGVWTAVSWPFYFATVWQLAAAIQVSASKLLLTAATAFSTLSGLLPISFQGVGTREAIFVVALAREGVSEERAVLLGLLTVTVVLLSSAIFGLLGSLLERLASTRDG